MTAVLRHDGNKEDFIKPFILTYRKSLNMSELLLIILVGMLEYCEASFFFNFLFFDFSEIKKTSQPLNSL